MRRFDFTIGLVFCVLGMVLAANANATERVQVFVSIVPQRYFVEKIGGDLVDVFVMVLPGNSPATYEPKPNQMVALSKSEIYFAIGVPFEKIWLKKIAAANPRIRVVHTDYGIEKRPIEREKIGGIKDPHIWLSPPQVIVQARNILTGLLNVDPVHAPVYEANFKKFIIELVDLDAEIRGIFKEKGKGMKFMVFHPSWGYFADAYGVEQIPIEIEGKNPKPVHLQRLIEHAKKDGIKVIFVQPQFSTKSAGIIAKAIGGEVVFANPLALNWAENIREQAAKFKAALR